MTDDQEKIEACYLIQHRNQVLMSTLTLSFTQRKAQGNICLYGFFYLLFFTCYASVYGVSIYG